MKSQLEILNDKLDAALENKRIAGMSDDFAATNGTFAEHDRRIAECARAIEDEKARLAVEGE